MKKTALAFFLLLSCVSLCWAEGYIWKKTLTCSAIGTINTPVFKLIGDKWRIRYSSKNQGPLLVHLYNEDGTFNRTLAKFNLVQGPKTFSGINPFGEKEVFLQIIGNEATPWVVELEQYVDEIQGWQIYRAQKQTHVLEKYGAWTGEAGEEVTIPLDIPAKHHRISYQAMEQGRLLVDVYGKDGYRKVHCYLFAAGTGHSWLHGDGNTVIKISSIGTPWLVSVEHE